MHLHGVYLIFLKVSDTRLDRCIKLSSILSIFRDEIACVHAYRAI